MERHRTTMPVRESKFRGWLIFAGIIVVVLALPLLRVRVLMGMARLAPILLFVGVLIFVLGVMGKRRKRGRKE